MKQLLFFLLCCTHYYTAEAMRLITMARRHYTTYAGIAQRAVRTHLQASQQQPSCQCTTTCELNQLEARTDVIKNNMSRLGPTPTSPGQGSFTNLLVTPFVLADAEIRMGQLALTCKKLATPQ